MPRATAQIGGELALGTRQFSRSLSDAERDLKSKVESMGRVKAPEIRGARMPLTEIYSGVQLVTGALGKLSGTARKLFDGEASMESLVRGLANTGDSSMGLRKELEMLAETAKLPGLGFREAIQGQTALKGAGLSATQAKDALEQFGNALTNAGRGRQELEGVISAIEQIVNTGLVDMQNLKEISRRVPGFMGIANSVDKSDPAKWLDGVIARLRELPRAAQGAKDEVDNLTDALDQKVIESTGGKVGAAVGGAAKQLSSLLSGGGFDFEKLISEIDGAGDMATKFQPSKSELERRKAVEEKQRAAAAKAREEESAALVKRAQEAQTLELDLQAARASGDADAIAAAEDKLDVFREVEAVSAALLLNEEQAANFIRQQNAERRRAAELIKTGGSGQAGRDAASARARLTGKRAERADNRAFLAGEKERLMREEGMSPADAEAAARQALNTKQDAETLARTGRNRIRSRQTEGASGLDNYLKESRLLKQTDPREAGDKSNIPGFDTSQKRMPAEAEKARLRKEQEALAAQQRGEGIGGAMLERVSQIEERLKTLNDFLYGAGGKKVP